MFWDLNAKNVDRNKETNILIQWHMYPVPAHQATFLLFLPYYWFMFRELL